MTGEEAIEKIEAVMEEYFQGNTTSFDALNRIAYTIGQYEGSK
jgi:hypothetical protein